MIDDDFKTVVIAVLLLIAGFTVWQSFFSDRIVEPFSELGVLGPNMKLGDYPQEAQVEEEFNLFLYVGNYMGTSQYYRVLVKLGDRSMNVTDENPLDAPVVTQYEAFLSDEKNTTIPITLSLHEAGVNRRLVFELYRYDNDASRFLYDNIWNQLWLNVTQPS